MSRSINALTLAALGLSLAAATGCGTTYDPQTAKSGETQGAGPACSLETCGKAMLNQQAYALKGDDTTATPAKGTSSPADVAKGCGAVPPALGSCCNKEWGINLYDTNTIRTSLENNININVTIEDWNTNNNENNNKNYAKATAKAKSENAGKNTPTNCCDAGQTPTPNGAGQVPNLPTPIALFNGKCNGDGYDSRTGSWECGPLAWTGAGCPANTPANKVNPPLAASLATGENVWGTTLNGCYPQTPESMLKFTATIPADWNDATLNFEAWEDVFEGHSNFIGDSYRVLVDGVEQFLFSKLNSPPPANGPFNWARRAIDLHDYAGKTVVIGFQFNATGCADTTAAGIYLRNLIINPK